MPSKLKRLPKDIAERLEELPEHVAGVHGLAALCLFGSFARGESTPISDVDIAFLPDPGLTDAGLDRFEKELYGVISRTLGTDEFTFANLRRAPAYFAWKVLTEGRVVLCRDDVSLAAFTEAVYRNAPDARWLRREGSVAFLEGFGMPEPAIERERLTDFLRLINEDLKTLREKARISKEAYLRSRDAQAIVERRLQTAVESCLNIGNHIVARLGLRAPQDYADVFGILGEARIIPFDLAGQMADMARFRNLLVHVYWQIDHGRVYDSLPARLGTLEAFASHIAQWLKARGSR